MSRNRLLKLLALLGLAVILALTIGSTITTSTVVSRTGDAANKQGSSSEERDLVGDVSYGSVQPPEFYNPAQASDPAGYFNQIYATVPIAVHDAARPPELYNPAQASDSSGYWSQIQVTMPIAVHDAAWPPEFYNLGQAPDIAGYWNAVSRSRAR